MLCALAPTHVIMPPPSWRACPPTQAFYTKGYEQYYEGRPTTLCIRKTSQQVQAEGVFARR